MSTSRTQIIPVTVLAAIFLVILVGFAYRHAPENSFHFDDEQHIYENNSVQMRELTLRNLFDAGLYATDSMRPLPSITFAIDWWRGDGHPAPFLWTNVVIHGLSTLAVFAFFLLILRRSDGETWPTVIAAFTGAALWATHPIQSQAVTYIVQRMASMSGLFVVLSLLCYLAGRAASRWKVLWFVLCALTLVLGCLSKQNAVMGLFLLLLAEYGIVRHGDKFFRRRRLDLFLLGLPLVAFLLLLLDVLSGHGPVTSLLAGYQDRDFSIGERLLTQPRVIAFHLSQISWPMPDRFSLAHDFPKSTSLFNPQTTWLSLIAVLVWISAGLFFLFKQERRIIGFFLLFFPIALIPESTIIPLEMVYEHRMYLPSVALAGLLALGVRRILLGGGPFLRGVVILLAFGLVLLLAGATQTRVAVWKDEYSLWSQAIRHAPGSARAHNNIGEALRNLKRVDEAFWHFQRAVEIDPLYINAVHNLGRIYRLKGKRSEAYRFFVRAVTLQPLYAPARFSLGMYYLETGNLAQAQQQFEMTVKLDPNHMEARRFLNFIKGYGKRLPKGHP